jgi:trehalose 2-sulfotransferase
MGGLFHKLRHPRRCYVVCAIPRSGSNLLTDGLHATRLAGVPKQFFLAKFESRYGADHGLDPSRDYAAYVRGIVNAKTTSNQVFGFKLMSWYLDDFLIRLRGAGVFGDETTRDLDLLQNAFPRLRFVHVFRRNKLRQALSTARALQTGLWKVQKGKTALREPQFDLELIEQCLKEAGRQEERWHSFFQRIGVDPFRVEYETLCDDYEATIRGILNFLRISLPRNVQIGPARTVRQADEISRVWEERFLAERPAASPPVQA